MLLKPNRHRRIESNKRRDEHNHIMRPISFPREQLSSSVNLRPWMTPVEQQLDINACCANAFAGVCEYLIKRLHGVHIDVSRLFIYYNGRRMNERTGHITDGGVVQRAIALGLQKYGCCKERTWPYIAENVNVKPSNEAYAKAREWTVIPLRIPCTIEAIETCLHNQLPVIIDIILLEEAGISFHPNSTHSRMPDIRTGLIDKTRFHSVVIIGYDRRTKHFYARNSWGEDWGDEGYFYMPYHYLSNHRLVNSADGLWTIKKIIRRQHHGIPTIRQLVLPNHRGRNHHGH
ncbi:hypothetical protein I4U23_006042 [Adineta vaga]|nr:hypothetical protein I4U23_006042 [Adineta vaga]